MFADGFKTKHVLIALAAVVVAVAGAVLALQIALSAEVVARGELLPYVRGYEIYRIRILDRFEFLYEPDYRPTADAFNTYVLVGIAFISLTFAIVIRMLSEAPRPKLMAFFASLFVGMNYLAADEFLGLHETLGHNMQFLSTLIPVSDRPDDIIILLYGIPALLFVAFFYRSMVASRLATTLFVTAVGFFLLGAISDGLKIPIEEICELISSIALISGVVTLGIHHTREAVAPDRVPVA